jgi:hypothetical protein
MPLNIIVAVMVFLLAASSDFLETRYVQAVNARRAELAARCSVAMWAVGCIGLVAVLHVGWWLLLPEGAGLYIGTMRAMK